MTVKGLIFDVDGVIADTEAVNARASIEMFAEMFGLHGVQRKDFEAGIGRGAEEYIRAAARVHGLKLTTDQVAAASKRRQEKFLEFLRIDPLPPFTGVLELMQEAESRPDWRVGIATSSNRQKSEAVLTSARIPYQRMTYVTGEEVKNKKPDPELFLTCAGRMDVPSSHCVVIEDAPNGIEAARAAGCACVGVTNSFPARDLYQASRIVESLTELDLDVLSKLSL